MEEAISIFRKEYNARGIFECELYPGIRACLKELSERGFHVAVASSKVERSCRRITDHFGITDYFFDIAGAIPEQNLEKKLGVINSFFDRHPDHRKDEAILIGDTHFDREGANAAGLGFVCVTYGYEDPDVLQTMDALAKLSSAGEIVPWILKAAAAVPRT